MPIRLLIADPYPVVRSGLVSFFKTSSVQIVAEEETADGALAKALELDPDAVLLETLFPDGSGFDVVARLRSLGFVKRAIFFTASDRQTHIARAVAAGADSYLLKNAAKAELQRVLTALTTKFVERRSHFQGDASNRVDLLGPYAGELRRAASLMRRIDSDVINPLTTREMQVLRHIALGLSNKEIASSLQLSLDTIKEHVQNILRKLEVDDRTQAAVWAVRNKLIP